MENNENKIVIGQNKTENRVIRTLDDLRNKFGDNLPLTHKEIADMCGTTNETVTRILVNLKKQEALKLSRGNIQIINISKMHDQIS